MYTDDSDQIISEKDKINPRKKKKIFKKLLKTDNNESYDCTCVVSALMISILIILIINIYNLVSLYKDRISELSNALEDLSSPFKKNFDDSDARNIRNAPNVAGNKMVDNIEGMYKSFFKKDIKWLGILKYLLYFCILTKFITTFTKPDFISLVTEIALAIIANTKMTNYLFEYYKIFFFGIIIGICYDIFDFLFVSNIEISSMSSVNSVVRFFGFIGFFGKLALLITIMVINQKNGNASHPSLEINN